MSDAAVGRPTTFRVDNLDEPARWAVTTDAPGATAVSVVERGIEIATVVGRHTLTLNRS
jgi:hypothetical protein